MTKFLVLLNLLTFTPDTVPTEVGTYPVVVEYSDGVQTKTKVIQFTVLSSDTVVEEYIAIDAHDFRVGEDAEINEEMIVLLSDAKAWNTSTGEDYEIEKLEVMKVEESRYEVILYSFQGINVMINIYIDEDYNESVVLNQEQGESFYDNYMFTDYNVQSISIVLFIILLILLMYLIIRRYNKLIDKMVTGIKKARSIKDQK